MAQKTIMQLVDDIDGTELDQGAGETVTFALDGQTYEIDLSSENANKLREVVAPYLAAGRRAGRPAVRTGKRSQLGSSAAEIREWARSNGFQVPDRGQIPKSVREAFDKR